MPRADGAADQSVGAEGLRLVVPEGRRRPTGRAKAPTQDQVESAPVNSDVLATLAHELRTPLSTLRVALETLASLPSGSHDDAARLMPHIQQGVGWLERLVDNLTATALVHTGHAPLRCVPVTVESCLHAALGVLQPLLDQRGQRVSVSGSSPPASVAADPVWFGQALLNLLSNASAYGPPGSLISVAVTRRPDSVELRVQDQGPGIPRCEQPKIFRPYVRGRVGRQTRGTGLGLGLHIVHTVVRLHGGTVGVRSTPGKGACFWLRLPALAPASSPLHLVEAPTAGD